MTMKYLKEIFDHKLHNQPTDIQSCSIQFTRKEDWKGYFEKGLKHLKENNLNVAEQCISQALRILSAAAPGTSDLNREKAKCFHFLAELYQARSSNQLKREDFCEMVVKRIALLEAERAYKHGTYTEDDKINSAISDAELRLIQEVFGSDGVQRFRNIGDRRIFHRKNLSEIRLKIINDYFPTLSSLPEWSSEEEQKRCEEIESIYETIHSDMKKFMCEIFQYCGDIAGPPPCSFSVIGLGSTSRKEGTPYSDLEFAILVDESADSDQRTYFRFLTYLIQAQIVKLGETIIPSVGIASLNDFYSENKEDDWFYDDVIPRGFSFDGTMPWACKTPLGRKEWRGKPALEFIMTIDEMLELQNVETSCDESLQTANVFSSVCHLFGDANLTASYQSRLSVTLTESERMKMFQQQVLTVMQRLLDTHDFHTLVSISFGTQQNVKKEVYRLASILVEQISKFFGIFSRGSWQCIRDMNERKIFTEEGAKNVLTALSIAAELRLQCYQRHGSQKEALPTVPHVSSSEKEYTPSSSAAAIVRLYSSLMPLSNTLCDVVEQQKLHDLESLMRSVFQRENFIDRTPFARALAYLRILQLPKAMKCLCSVKNYIVDTAVKVQVLLVLAHCYHMVAKFQKARECCQEVQNLYSQAPETVERKNVLIALIIIMDTYTDLSLYEEAVKTHDQIAGDYAEDFGEDFIHQLEFRNSSAILFMKMEQYARAEATLRGILEKLTNPRKYYANYFICINNLAAIFLEEDRLTEAKAILETALSVASELYGENAVHPYFACCLTNLGKVEYGLDNEEEANRVLHLALIIYHRVHEQQLIEPSIVDALITQARAYQMAGRWEEMRRPLLEAKEITRILYQDQPHPKVATVLLLLGYCEQARGKFVVALHHYQDCLKIREEHCKKRGESEMHDCATATVLLRMASLGKSCSHDSTYLLSLIEKAFQTEEEIHGKKSNHSHLAICLSRLGHRLMHESNGAQGLEYLEKAIQMFQEMNLRDTFNYGQTQVTTGMVLRDVSPSKSEKHLRIAEAIFRKTIKDDSHILFLEINSALLHIFKDTSRIHEGLELAKAQRSLINKRLSKCSDPNLRELKQVFWLASFYEDCGRRNTAREVYIGLISRLEEQVDVTDPEDELLMFLLWTTQEAVAAIYQSNEMLLEAEAMFQRCAASTRKSTSKHSLVGEARLISQCHLASVFSQTGKFAEALDILNGLIMKYEHNSEFVDPTISSSAFQLRGELFRRQRLLELALKDLLTAKKIAEDFRATVSGSSKSAEANQLYSKIMNTIGLVYEQGNAPKLALDCYMCCIDVAQGMKPTMDTATFHQNAGDTLKTLGNLQDALKHYTKSLEIRETLNLEDPVREDIATVLYHMALTQFEDEKCEAASKTLDKLLPLRTALLKRGGSLQNYCAALILKGNCHIRQPGEAQEAKDAYVEAETVLKKMSEGQPNSDYATVLGNIGYACQLLNQQDEMISKLHQALQMRRIIHQNEKSSPEIALGCFLLAEALSKSGKYEEALPYFQEALEINQALESTSDAAECLLNIALCYTGLKKLNEALETLTEVERSCGVKALNERMALCFHKEMADVLIEKDEEVKTKGLWHLQQAEAILERIKQNKEDEERLNELKAMIMSLQIV